VNGFAGVGALGRGFALRACGALGWRHYGAPLGTGVVAIVVIEVTSDNYVCR
jgi:hypothetical protein